MEKPTKINDLGVPLFQETTISMFDLTTNIATAWGPTLYQSEKIQLVWKCIHH